MLGVVIVHVRLLFHSGSCSRVQVQSGEREELKDIYIKNLAIWCFWCFVYGTKIHFFPFKSTGKLVLLNSVLVSAKEALLILLGFWRGGTEAQMLFAQVFDCCTAVITLITSVWGAGTSSQSSPLPCPHSSGSPPLSMPCPQGKKPVRPPAQSLQSRWGLCQPPCGVGDPTPPSCPQF